jgi:hypothetical protein
MDSKVRRGLLVSQVQPDSLEPLDREDSPDQLEALVFKAQPDLRARLD